MTHFGKIYLSNKMSDIPFFNAPWFDLVAAQLRIVDGVTDVFNPAQHDRDMGLDPMLCPTGSAEEARKAGGLGIRDVLGADWKWIADHATGLVVGPAWPQSVGAISEIACAQALKIPVWESVEFFKYVMAGRPELLLLSQHQLPSFKDLLHAYT